MPISKIAASLKIDSFMQGYIECALWAETDDEGTPLDQKYTIDNIAPSTLDAMKEDCFQFEQQCALLMEDVVGSEAETVAGHDFWLTRNHHGSGFWDSDYEHKQELTDAAHGYGQADLYVGDDGYIYQMGTESGEVVPPQVDYELNNDDKDMLKSMGIQGRLKSALKSALLKQSVFIEDQWIDILQKKGWVEDESLETSKRLGWDNTNWINPEYPDVAVEIHQEPEQSYFVVMYNGHPATRSSSPEVLWDMLENVPRMGNWNNEPVQHDTELSEADKEELKRMGIQAATKTSPKPQYKLINSETGQEIPIGSVVPTFRGEKVKVLSFTPPKHEGSTGRVYVEFVDDSGKGVDDPDMAWRQEYYPGVIGAKIVFDNSFTDYDKAELKSMGIEASQHIVTVQPEGVVDKMFVSAVKYGEDFKLERFVFTASRAKAQLFNQTLGQHVSSQITADFAIAAELEPIKPEETQ